MKKLIISFLAFFVAALLLLSCNKDEGEGGTAVIEGTLMQVLHPDDDYSLSTDTVPAAKTDVFIIYGDDVIYGDDMKTDPQGHYRFKYLKPGTYTIFAYSVLPSGEKVAVYETVTIKHGEKVTVPTIYIHEGKAYGTSMIKGQVWAEFIHKGEHVDYGWAYEHRVYICKEGDPYHFDDVRVGDEGYFYFQKLLPGKYDVYTVTENEDEIPSLKKVTVTVEDAGEIYDVGLISVVINV